MRASLRKRSPDAGVARAAVALLAVCAGLAAGTALAGSSVEARALAAARQVAARAETRAHALNVIAGASASRRTLVPAKAVVPAKPVPAAVAIPTKVGNPALRPPVSGRPRSLAAFRWSPASSPRPPEYIGIASVSPNSMEKYAGRDYDMTSDVYSQVYGGRSDVRQTRSTPCRENIAFATLEGCSYG